MAQTRKNPTKRKPAKRKPTKKLAVKKGQPKKAVAAKRQPKKTPARRRQAKKPVAVKRQPRKKVAAQKREASLSTRKIPLRGFNNVLTVVVVILGLYIVGMPFLPGLWWSAKHTLRNPDLVKVQVTQKKPVSQPITPGYWLNIPRLDMHTQIYTGMSISELNKGVWLIPSTSTPDNGSNTVVAGHRFTYTNPQGIFYYLDKVQLDDRITVDWLGTEYTYKVVNIEVVPPTEISVQNPTQTARFTLYTCTPLLTAKDRLVVQADLISKRSS